MGLHTCTAVARSLCVSWAFLYRFYSILCNTILCSIHTYWHSVLNRWFRAVIEKLWPCTGLEETGIALCMLRLLFPLVPFFKFFSSLRSELHHFVTLHQKWPIFLRFSLSFGENGHTEHVWALRIVTVSLVSKSLHITFDAHMQICRHNADRVRMYQQWYGNYPQWSVA